jgi:hypothetical protein
MNTTLSKQCAAEFIGTFALIFVGVGAIYHNVGLLAVAFAHGLTIAVMASATAGISGGHLNPADDRLLDRAARWRVGCRFHFVISVHQSSGSRERRIVGADDCGERHTEPGG